MPTLDDVNWNNWAQRTCCLELANMNYGGTIPTQIGLLTGFTQGINLNDNGLTGPIPTEIGLLRNLEYELDLSGNKLTGEIPSEIGRTVMCKRYMYASFEFLILFLHILFARRFRFTLRLVIFSTSVHPPIDLSFSSFFHFLCSS